MLCNLYRCIKRRVGRLHKRTHCKRHLVPSGKQVAYLLELEAVFPVLNKKEFQDLCIHKIVIVETDNTTVVSYINKEGGMRSGPLGSLLWRILTWCTRNQVTPKAQHIPGLLSVVADKQAIWARPDHLNSGLSFRRSSKQYMQQVALASNRPMGHRLNNKLPLYLRHQIP